MSRSYKRSRYRWIAGDSAKEGKRDANSRLRSRVKMWLHTLRNLDLLTSFNLRDVSDPWGWSVDGKTRIKEDEDYLMRK